MANTEMSLEERLLKSLLVWTQLRTQDWVCCVAPQMSVEVMNTLEEFKINFKKTYALPWLEQQASQEWVPADEEQR